MNFEGCDRNYTGNQGIIETPGYKTNTTFTFSSCTWRIQVATGSRVNLTLTDWIGWNGYDSDHSFQVCALLTFRGTVSIDRRGILVKKRICIIL